MNPARHLWLFLLACLCGAVYFIHVRLDPMSYRDALVVAEKGGGVALLGLWAALNARGLDGWLIAAVMALGALGDVLLETAGLSVGAVAFLAGHVVAILFYWRNRKGHPALALAVAGVVTLVAFLLPADRAAAPGIALYAAGLGAMAGMAAISRFPPLVGIGALLFVISDLLIFSRMGPLHGSAIPGLLIWPTYVAAQALIAWGVVRTLRAERAP